MKPIKKLLVVSHKEIWKSDSETDKWMTDGGFAFHMWALSQLFGHTRLILPVKRNPSRKGEVQLSGNNVSVIPIETIGGAGLRRKINYLVWFFKHYFLIKKQIREADAVHIPIPSDIGTLAMILAHRMKKPLFIRYCGNWLVSKTRAENWWHAYLEKIAGGKNVVLTTGVEDTAPSKANAAIKWIFSSSLTEKEIIEMGESRAEYSVSPFVITIVCRQEKAKGTAEMLEALALLRAEGRDIKAKVVGDGSALSYFRQLAAQLNITDSVEFTGKLNHEQVMGSLQSSQLFVFPTRSSEGFPKCVLEAMACGLPVVATPVSAIKHLLSAGGGILISDTQANTIAQAIKDYMDNPSTWQEAQLTNIHVAKQYSLENWAREIGSHLEAAWAPEYNIPTILA